MTLLQARKIVLREIAKSLNDDYFALFRRIEDGRLTPNEARFVGAEIESLEEMTNYARNEAEAIEKARLREAVKEVASLWRKESQ